MKQLHGYSGTCFRSAWRWLLFFPVFGVRTISPKSLSSKNVFPNRSQNKIKSLIFVDRSKKYRITRKHLDEEEALVAAEQQQLTFWRKRGESKIGREGEGGGGQEGGTRGPGVQEYFSQKVTQVREGRKSKKVKRKENFLKAFYFSPS